MAPDGLPPGAVAQTQQDSRADGQTASLPKQPALSVNDQGHDDSMPNHLSTSDTDDLAPCTRWQSLASTPAPFCENHRESNVATEPTPRDDRTELRRKHEALSKNFGIAKASLRKRTNELDKWIRYSRHLQKLIYMAEKTHGIQILNSQSQSPPVPAPAAAHLNDSTTVHCEEAVSGKMAFDGTDVDPAEKKVSDEQSGSTQGNSARSDADDGATVQLPALLPAGPNDSAVIKEEPSSDEPMVISERAVRKRKRGDLVLDTAEPKLKTEPARSSSPIAAGIPVAGKTQGDVDLDEIEQRLVTPRKQKTLEHYARPDYVTAPQLRTLAMTSTSSAAPKPSSQQISPSKERSVLSPLSVNISKPKTSAGSKPSRRSSRRGLAFAISALAEDGGLYGTTPPSAKKHSPAADATSSDGRLHALLNSPSLAPTDPDIRRADSRRRERRRVSEDHLTVTGQHRLSKRVAKPSKDNVDSIPRLDLPSNGCRASETSPTRRKKTQFATPLRARPVAQLQLRDFKVNPLANDGHDFAFADVVRGKDERACLPGCTDQHCCGKQFRALALSQRPDPPLTPKQRMEEQKLLEGYLGPDAHRLASMAAGDKAELWVEAKAQELATKYGKHRHRFSRMQSPPGFWNADFPNTQEMEQDRNEAANRERQEITKRHREAMRPGGRWLFRDE